MFGGIQTRCHFVKMTRTHPTSIKDHEIGMFEVGMKRREVAKKLNIHRSSVRSSVIKFLTEGNVDRVNKVATSPRKTRTVADTRLLR